MQTNQYGRYGKSRPHGIQEVDPVGVCTSRTGDLVVEGRDRYSWMARQITPWSRPIGFWPARI